MVVPIGGVLLRLLLLPLFGPSPLPARGQNSPCLTRFSLDGRTHCSMDEDGMRKVESAKDTGRIERSVRATCAVAGLSKQDCAILTSATVKSVGEELAWRRDHRLESREDAIRMLSDWGWGKTVWLFGDSHMRKMTRTLLRALDADSETRQVVGNHEDCGIAQNCWCPTIFRIFQDGGRVERLDFSSASTSSNSSSTSITLIFRYFVVRRDNAAARVQGTYGTYDRPCVFKEGAETIAETIRQWRQMNRNDASSALVNPDVIIFNGGNWESNEGWEVDVFAHDLRRRAEALMTAFLPSETFPSSAGKKLIFLGPPFFDDRISQLDECPDKWNPKTSARIHALNKAAVRYLREAGIATVDVFSMTKSASAEQFAFFRALGWAGGLRFELCSNHQTPSMYSRFWQMLTTSIVAEENRYVRYEISAKP